MSINKQTGPCEKRFETFKYPPRKFPEIKFAKYSIRCKPDKKYCISANIYDPKYKLITSVSDLTYWN